MAYSYLCLSLSLINEGTVGEYKTDLTRIVSGFCFLSEIVDVFINLFSVSELKQIQASARNAISVSARNVKEYFEKGLELSNLVTQLRAYSSLIILKVEEHINILREREHGQMMVVATESKSQSHQSKLEILPDMPNNRQRPFALCAGEFVVPDDFDKSLPEDILSAFEGK